MLALHGPGHPSHGQDWRHPKCPSTNKRQLKRIDIVHLLIKRNALQQIPPLVRFLPQQKMFLLRALQLILTALPPTTTLHHWTCSTLCVPHGRGFEVDAVENLICCKWLDEVSKLFN